MTYEQIEKIVQGNESRANMYEIRFKKRNPVKGLFIKTTDYTELSRKNLWRIVSENHVGEFKKTNDERLARIFNGTEFTGLVAQPDARK